MAALAVITPTNLGTVSAGAGVAASDTIAQALMGPRGLYLEIINAGGSVDNITISDHGLTPAGNALTNNQITDTVTNATSQIYWIRPEQFNPATNLVTITHSFTTSVTYKLYPV